MGITSLNLAVFVRNSLCFSGCDKAGSYSKHPMTSDTFLKEHNFKKSSSIQEEDAFDNFIQVVQSFNIFKSSHT